MAIDSYDIVSTLQALGMMKYWKGKHIILKKQVRGGRPYYCNLLHIYILHADSCRVITVHSFSRMRASSSVRFIAPGFSTRLPRKLAAIKSSAAEQSLRIASAGSSEIVVGLDSY